MDKINGNSTIYPIVEEQSISQYADLPNTMMVTKEFGLTKREYFAALNNAAILGAFFSSDAELRLKQVKNWMDKYGSDIKISEAMSLDSVGSADSLIEALNK